MIDKVHKIRKEVARIQLYTQSEVLKQVLDYIDEVQKEPVSEDKMTISKEWFEHCKKSWYNEGYIDGEYNRDRQFEDTVSEDFEEALAKEWKGYNDRGAATVDALEDNTQELSFAKGFYRGSKWKAEQFEKNRLDACDKQTEEEAEIESDFVMGIIEKEHRQPTFDDAIKYGMKLKEQQMMSNAIDAHCFGFQGDALFSFRLPADKYLVGSEVKVIVIKKK